MPQPWAIRLGKLAYLPKIAARHEPTLRTFAEETLIERLFASGEPLAGVGVGLSERVIEIPWVLRRLSEATESRRVLDVGTAYAPIAYKRLLLRLMHQLDTLDLAPSELPGAISHVGDVRKMQFDSNCFDFAVCISTLEHVGLDNSLYGIEEPAGGNGDRNGDCGSSRHLTSRRSDNTDDGSERERDESENADRQALAELGRVARRVLVTVPAGRDANMGWQRQYSPARFRRLAEHAGLEVERLETFSHDPERGWIPVEEEAVTARMYGEGAVAAAANICAELRRA